MFRLVRLAAAVGAALILPVAASGCSAPNATANHHRHPATASRSTTTRPRRTSSTSRPSTASTTPAPPSTAATTTTSPNPSLATNPAGGLPQTDAYPSASSNQFTTEMKDLWAGILADSVSRAIWSFFPEAAYDQLKAIADPDYDWRERLVGDFELDLRAAHDYVDSSPGASSAKLLDVAVDGEEVAWIPPGYCYNSIGYWHAPGVRLVYEQDGATRSIGIASLISWRGEWYVVHLGAVLRSGSGGIVDDPESGEGTFAPAGGC